MLSIPPTGLLSLQSARASLTHCSITPPSWPSLCRKPLHAKPRNPSRAAKALLSCRKDLKGICHPPRSWLNGKHRISESGIAGIIIDEKNLLAADTRTSAAGPRRNAAGTAFETKGGLPCRETVPAPEFFYDAVLAGALTSSQLRAQPSDPHHLELAPFCPASPPTTDALCQ